MGVNWKPQHQRYMKTNVHQYVLNMGDVAVTANSGEIVCYGLGSCVGLFLYDRFRKVGAAAHVALPANERFKESETMIEQVVNGMIKKGCNPLTMRAKLVGGANVMNMNCYQVGKRNEEYIKTKLRKWGIMVQAEDTGGRNSRTARLNIESGEIAIRTNKKDYYKL